MTYRLIIKRIPFNVKLTKSGIDFPFYFEPQIYSQKVDHFVENDVIFKDLDFERLKKLVLYIPTVEKYYSNALRVLVNELGVAEVELYKELEIPDEEIQRFINYLRSLADDIGVELKNVK